jgi:hypothetical protein
MTITSSSEPTALVEEARRALVQRASSPIAVPSGAEGIWQSAALPACAELQSASTTPVALYIVTLEGTGVSSVSEPECWRLPAFDTEESSARAAALCVPPGVTMAPAPSRLVLGTMYEPIVDELWQQIEEGNLPSETINVLLTVAKPLGAQKAGPMPAG